MSYKSVLLITLLFFIPLLAGAASDTFLLRLLVGTDTNPPSVPVITTTTPLSVDQIDIVWGASSDDVYVSGYRIYRDGILLATTTLTSFSDTGLLPTTLYTYEVDAFDLSGNYSGTSTPVATTTLDVPVVPTDPNISSQGSDQPTAVVGVRSVNIVSDQTSATLNISAYGPVRYIVRFGQTSAYELGAISNNILRVSHQSKINGLEPGTKYFVEITLINNLGVSKVVEATSFVTEPAVNNYDLSSVSDFRSTVFDNDVMLSWKNNNPNEKTVRIVRSHLFYPNSPTDGVVIYEGNDLSYKDENILSSRPSYYYSAFVMGGDGRFSAAAITMVTLDSLNQDQTESLSVEGDDSTSSAAVVDPVDIDGVGPRPNYESLKLDPGNVFISYLDKTVLLSDHLSLPTGTVFTLMIPVSALAPHLKSVILTVGNATDHNEQNRYLLKLNHDGTAYVVTFNSSEVVGEGDIRIEVFDYELAKITTLNYRVLYTSPDKLSGSLSISVMFYVVILPIVILLLGFIWWWLISIKRQA